jgi:hypothetical protein
MGPGIFLIAIMGCGEGDSACTTVRTLETRYETRAACTAATNAALEKNSDADFPVVVAQCVAAAAKPTVLKAAQVRLPDGGSAPTAVSPLSR